MNKERVVLAIIVAGILIFAIAALQRPSITGFVPTTVYSQNIELSVGESGFFWLKSADGNPLRLTSLSISGSVEGDGVASVYLYTPQDSRLLVYSNLKKIGSAMAPITGMASRELLIVSDEPSNAIESVPSGYEAVAGPFDSACMETCILPLGVFNQTQYKLEIVVTPGTVLKLTEIRFTVEE